MYRVCAGTKTMRCSVPEVAALRAQPKQLSISLPRLSTLTPMPAMPSDGR